MISDKNLKLEIENLIREELCKKFSENEDSIALIKTLDTSKLPAKIAKRILEV